MSGRPEVSPRAELDRCLIIAATVGNKWLLYTVNRVVLTRRRPPTLREGIFLVLVFVCICVAFASSNSALFLPCFALCSIIMFVGTQISYRHCTRIRKYIVTGLALHACSQHTSGGCLRVVSNEQYGFFYQPGGMKSCTAAVWLAVWLAGWPIVHLYIYIYIYIVDG